MEPPLRFDKMTISPPDQDGDFLLLLEDGAGFKWLSKEDAEKIIEYLKKYTCKT